MKKRKFITRRKITALYRRQALMFVSIFFSSLLFGQEEIHFQQYTEEDGLSSNSITQMIQDQRGWLWIASPGGLCRYDGRQFKIYKSAPDDPASLIHNIVLSIHESRDGRIWVGTGGGLDVYDPNMDEFSHYTHQVNDPKSLGSNTIWSILEDTRGDIWIGTDKGLNRLNINTGLFDRLQNLDGSDRLIDNGIFGLIEDKSGFIWIASGNSGLFRFDPETERFENFQHDPTDPNSISNNQLWSLYEDKKGFIWIGTIKNGINRYNPTTQRFDVFYPNPQNKYSGATRSIFEDKSGTLWFGASAGLFRFDRKSERFFPYTPESKTPINQKNNPIWTMLQDREGTYWMGTRYGGLYSFTWKETSYRHYDHDLDNPKSINDNWVQCIYKDRQGEYWIGTSKGLNHFDPNTEQFKTYYPNANDRQPLTRENNLIFQIYEDRSGKLWIGSSNGLKRFDRETETFFHYWHNPDDLQTIGNNDIRSIYEGQSGKLWIGAYNGGLNLYNPDADNFSRYLYDEQGSAQSNSINSIQENQPGRFWLGTTDGLISFEPAINRKLNFQHDPEDIQSISNSAVNDIKIDSKGNLWIGTFDGLNTLKHKDSISFDYFLQKDGLSSSWVTNIEEDAKGNLWISTINGFSVFWADAKKFQSYFSLNGMELGEISHSFYDPETNKMWLGTENGLIIIHPDSLPRNDYKPPIVISRFNAYQRTGEESGFKEIKAIWGKSAVTLPYRENTFSVEFSVLSYKNPAENQVAYQLQGVNDDWIYLGAKREAAFSNLRPGKYVLRVKGSNNDDVWNEEGASLQITILPPWQLTIWAKILYLFLAAGLLYSLYRYQLKRKLALAEARRLQELDQVKTKLFTNITHEFRTPLTLIQGMAEQTINRKGKLPAEKNLENARIVKRNSAQLLNLINQMLDLRKLESGAMPLRMIQGDVLQYLRYLIESFHSYAQDKGVKLHFLARQKELIMDYDPEKLLYIVSNLLSNAIKFTPKNGDVYVSASLSSIPANSPAENKRSSLEIQVKDTGVGIEAEKLPHIFDRFYQTDDSPTRRGEGVGIGLALSRELVYLLKGEIKVDSELGTGTNFTLSLPISRKAPKNQIENLDLDDKMLGFKPPIAPLTGNAKAQPLILSDAPLALIIEDNPDVVRYLQSCLENDYNILTAHNGQTGVQTAIDTTPDIIISDVMMPEKNGYEVCDILKSDERTSHIPIILLTAKSDQDARLTGLRKGADAYLSKPFHQEELKVRLEQLIEIRRKLQERYANLNLEEMNQLPSNVEDEFLRKVRQIVEANLSDSEFDIAQLCRAVGMSRSQLFRKLKALTGKSASLVIRSIRLQKARHLLKTSRINVSEAAYTVGFKDLAYFSKCFSEEYGEQPSSVRSS